MKKDKKITTSKRTCTIFTLPGYYNYGNRLQLFALTKVLNKLGFKTYAYKRKTFKSIIKEFLKHNTPLGLFNKKEVKLKKFTRKYIREKSIIKQTDYSVVGSDQVWNPNFFKNRPFLIDVPNESVKVSYAASIGKETLTEDELSRFKASLNNYKRISVRERSAKDLLQPITDKEIEVVLDPTLLLSKEDYIKLEKKPKNIETGEKYILCYILGGTEQMDAINTFALEHGYRIIPFSDRNDSRYGVEEFLYLIHHAALICTDSFHACVFSIIFERPFVAFRRTGKHSYMFTRLQNLINTFELKNREYNGTSITKENVNLDYSKVNSILETRRKESLRYLKTALEVEDEN